VKVENHFFAGSKHNTDEVEIVMKLLVQFLEKGELKENDIGIITPYSAQVQKLNDAVKQRKKNVEVKTVDGFQGREKELIIFSCVRCNTAGNIGFLSDERRFNVMHTRARRGLIVVGSRSTLVDDDLWRSWFEWVDKEKLTCVL